MIPVDQILRLINHRLDDSQVLLKNRRYYGAIYVCGYALELALKYRFCKKFKLRNGFPENRVEFNSYSAQLSSLPLIKKLGDIKIHNLDILLLYSGMELTIKRIHTSEWAKTFFWTPNMRYKIRVTRRREAKDFIDSARIIIKALR